jgi:hypothetical protein
MSRYRDSDPLGLNGAVNQPPEIAIHQVSAELRARLQARDTRARRRRIAGRVVWFIVAVIATVAAAWLILKG